jgi:hypothetical protein
MIETRWATQADVETYYGHLPRETIQAYVALLDGQPVGLIGIARNKTHARCFSEFKPELRRHLRCVTILRVIKKAMALVRESRVPVIAISQVDEPTSARILQRLGFRYLKASPIGDVYKWHT